jgi:hypothetical protein
VAGAVAGTVVGLDFHETRAKHGAVSETTAQEATQEVASDVERVAPVE